MHDPYYAGALWWPGYNAGYTSGRSWMVWSVRHFTVGTNSVPIGVAGYFHWLQQRGGGLIQFCEADAICWHAGEANPFGDGTEMEYLPGVDDEILTPAAIAAQQLHVAWRTLQWGIPTDSYLAGWPRIPPGSFAGYIDHGAIAQSQPHTDYWPDDAWQQIIGAPAPTPDPLPPEDDDVIRFVFYNVKNQPGSDEIPIDQWTWSEGGVWRHGHHGFAPANAGDTPPAPLYADISPADLARELARGLDGDAVPPAPPDPAYIKAQVRAVLAEMIDSD